MEKIGEAMAEALMKEPERMAAQIQAGFVPVDDVLDALVATRIFGLVPCLSKQAHGKQGYPGERCYADPASPDQGGDLPRYSSDVEAAWTVVHRMLGQDYFMALDSPWDVFSRQQWKCFFFHKDNFDEPPLTRERKGHGEGETAPEAICRAALAAEESSRTVKDGWGIEIRG